jgi:hypothetical protein
MQFPKTPFALAAIALASASPLCAQTSLVTIQAESMALSSYAVENGNRIKLTAAKGTATKSFSGASGTYDVQVYVQPESDGQSILEVYKGATLLQKYTYPLSDTATSFTIKNVPVSSGETLKLVGTANAGAVARVDKVVLTPVSASTSTSSTSTSSTSSTPYSGTPVALPKAFQAVNFDKGGQNVAYLDLTGGNSGGLYRSAEDVDITATTDAQGGGYTVSNFQSGEWLKYTVNVPSNGLYDLAIRAAANQASAATFHVEVDGVNVTGPITVPNTGNLNTYQWVGKQGVSLTAGKRVLKVVSDQQYFNMDAVSVLASSAGTSAPLTIEAESMALASYAVENGNRIKLTAAKGTATKSFSGASGTYDVQVYVQPESDGQSILEVYKGATLLQKYTYPLSDTATSFTIKNVTVSSGETLKLVGTANAGAVARVDKMVFTRVSTTSTSTTTTPTSTTPATTTPTTTTPTTTPTPLTIEAESMALASYAVENGNRIKLTAASGTATKGFSGASGTYDMQVYVQPESDGQSTLEVYKGATLLQKYTYPLSDTATTFTIKNVAVSSGETLKLVGTANAGAVARVDKIVLSPASTTSTTPTPTPTPTPTATACANPAGGYEGFGRNTTGGAGQPIYRVTNLNDSGAGSLRDAVSAGRRCVVFDVAGTITLASQLNVRGGNITIDGFTAPSPGITVRGGGLSLQGGLGATNVVVRGIRVRNVPADGISIYQASNIVVDHVSVSGFMDGAIDVTEGSRDVTIQWSIIGNGGAATHNFPNLIGYRTLRVTSHHNLYSNGDYRHPYCGTNNGTTTLPSEVVCDVRNNLMWDYGGHGTAVMDSGTANIVNNYYYTTKSSASNTINIGYIGVAGAYVSGNHSQNGWSINGVGNRSTPYPAVVPRTTDAITAAHEVIAKAGARCSKFGLDAADQTYVGQVRLQ